MSASAPQRGTTEAEGGGRSHEGGREGKMAAAAAAATVGSQAPITSLPHKRARKKKDRLRKQETRKGTGQAGMAGDQMVSHRETRQRNYGASDNWPWVESSWAVR